MYMFRISSMVEGGGVSSLSDETRRTFAEKPGRFAMVFFWMMEAVI